MSSNPYDTAKQKKTSVLGPTLRFKGELSAEEDLLIQGRIEGSIKHTSSLTVGEKGQIKANISAEYIAVEGKVNGDLSGSQSVVVRDTANVEGNIFSPIVTLLEGATFNGSIDMTGKKAADSAPAGAPEPVKAATDSHSADDPEGASNGAKRKSQRADKKPASAA